MKKGNHILLFGPGGVGKTTVGKILAAKLGYSFLDLDQIFCDRIGKVADYIKQYSYKDYCIKNSKLFDQIKPEIHSESVIAFSSGYLIYDTLLGEENYSKIKHFGYKILLLSSRDIDIATSIVVDRQLKRGFDLVKKNEILKFRERFIQYQKYKYNIKIYSSDSPEQTARDIIDRLNSKISPK